MIKNILKYGILLGIFTSSAMCDPYMVMSGRLHDLFESRTQTNTPLSNEDMEWVYSQVKNLDLNYVRLASGLYWEYLIGSGEYDTGTKEQRNEIDRLERFLLHKYNVDHNLIAG